MWQPIETAPKDGTEFDAWCSKHEGYTDAPKRVANVRHNGEFFEFLHSHGWFKVSEKMTLTHWMPLPDPPK